MNITERRRRTTLLLPVALLIFIWALWQPRDVLAQWATNGNNINNTNTGSVGIGTSDPSLQGSVNSKLTIVQTDGQTAFSFGNTGGVPRFALNGNADGSWTFYDFAGGSWLPGLTQKLGNIGIGTSSPGALLEINKSQNAGTTIIMDNAYTAAGNSAYSGVYIKQAGANRFFFGSVNNGNTAQNGGPGAVQLWNFVNGPMLFATNSVERMRIDGAGNLGIGIQSPMFRTHIVGGAGAPSTSGVGSGTLLIGDTTQAQTGSLLLGYVSGTSGYSWMQSYGGLPLQINPLGNNTLINTVAGSVGVGTSTPAYKLDVAGQIRSTSGFVFPDGTVQTTAATGGGGGSSQWITTGANIYYNTGSIGIGTSSPGAKLDIISSGNSRVLAGDGCTAAPGTYGGIGLGINSFNNCQNYALLSNGVELYVNAPSTSGNIHFRTGNNGNAGTDYMTVVGSTGNVGIGTSSPQAKLDVQGNVSVTGNVTATGNIAAKYQDVAEWVPSSQKLSAGTVVILDPEKSNQVIASTEAYDTRVAGVISDSPGVILGEGGEGKLKVATTGRVRVRVDATNAPIKIGDLLVTSDEEGVAMKSVPMEINGRKIHAPGTIIGKALEPLEKGKGEILVLLSLQ